MPRAKRDCLSACTTAGVSPRSRLQCSRDGCLLSRLCRRCRSLPPHQSPSHVMPSIAHQAGRAWTGPRHPLPHAVLPIALHSGASRRLRYPLPDGAGTSPSGNRTARRIFRVDTLIHQVQSPTCRQVTPRPPAPSLARHSFRRSSHPRSLIATFPHGSDLARRGAPTNGPSRLAAANPRPASRLGVRLHHRGSVSIRPPGRPSLRTQTLRPTPYPWRVRSHSSLW